jgi:hypothetical protein
MLLSSTYSLLHLLLAIPNITPNNITAVAIIMNNPTMRLEYTRQYFLLRCTVLSSSMSSSRNTTGVICHVLQLTQLNHPDLLLAPCLVSHISWLPAKCLIWWIHLSTCDVNPRRRDQVVDIYETIWTSNCVASLDLVITSELRLCTSFE